MALLQPRMFKIVTGTTVPSLTAGPDESFLVTNVMVYNPASAHAVFYIDRTAVADYRVSGPLGNHLAFPLGRTAHAHDWTTSSSNTSDQNSFAGLENAGGSEIAAAMIGGLSKDTTYRRVGSMTAVPSRYRGTLIELLRERGLLNGYPVASGETFQIGGVAQNGAITVIEYQRYEPGDISPEMPNGSKANEYTFVSYGSAGANINTDGDTLLDESETSAEFPDFPFGKNVPAGAVIFLHGILASDVAPAANDGTDYCYTEYLKLIRGRTVLFDDDKNGLLYYSGYSDAYGDVDIVGEGVSVGGNYSDVDCREPFWLDPPLEFHEGEELQVYWTTEQSGNGQNIGTTLHEVGMILTVRYGGGAA